MVNGAGMKVRILRLLEYVGDRDAIEFDLSRRGVKGEATHNKKYIIREAFLSPGFPEFNEVAEQTPVEVKDGV